MSCRIVGMRRFQPRRRYGGASGRRTVFKPGRLERNHCEMTTSTVGGTELVTVVAGASDDQTSRGSTTASVPQGAIMRRISVRLWATDATPVNGKHQCMLVYLGGATAFATPMASWFSVTNPLTEEAIQVRQAILNKRGPDTKVVVSGAAFPLTFSCFWKGKRVMHDGDSIRLVQLDGTATNWTAVCDYTYVR